MLKQLLYLPYWFFRSVVLGQKRPLQTVLFITDKCNLRCKHCSVYQIVNPHSSSLETIREQLTEAYQQGSRFVDIEGGETTLWKDVAHEGHEGTRSYDLNDVIRVAKEVGFFSVTITTNAQQDFSWVKTDSLWVSMDGIHQYHDAVRGEGTFARLEKNLLKFQSARVQECKSSNLCVNMVINTLNYNCLEDALEYAKQNPAIALISLNFHTPYPGTEYLMLDDETRNRCIDTIIAYKKKGYPIMNSVSGLKRMKNEKLKMKNRVRGKYCWMTNFIYPDGSKGYCVGYGTEQCQHCGFCMSGEMEATMHLKPDTIWAALKLRVKSEK